jgi:hypothetical protein
MSNQPIPVSATDSQKRLLLTFATIKKLKPQRTGSHIASWEYSCALKLAKHLAPSDLILIPSEPPNIGEAIDLHFLSTSNPWLLQCTRLVDANDIIGSFTVHGRLRDEGDRQFQKSDEIVCPFTSTANVILLSTNSPVGSMFSTILPSIKLGLPPPPSSFASGDDNSRHTRSEDAIAIPITPSTDQDFYNSVNSTMSGVKRALEPNLVDSGEEEDSDTDPSPSQPSRRGKYFFTDLDGVTRESSVDTKQVHLHICLFRMLCKKRIETFLRNLTLNIPEWKLEITLQSDPNLTSQLNDDTAIEFESLGASDSCRSLLAYSNDNLFESFLKLSFDPFNYNNLGLFHFLSAEDRNVIWVDRPTSEGRKRIIQAVRNLLSFISCNQVKLANYDDIFIRHQIELMLLCFSRDIKRPVSLRFSSHRMNNSKACKRH